MKCYLLTVSEKSVHLIHEFNVREIGRPGYPKPNNNGNLLFHKPSVSRAPLRICEIISC